MKVGYAFLGKKHTKETKAKMSKAHMGNKYRLGIKQPKEFVENLRKRMLGNKKGFQKGRIPWNKGMKGYNSGEQCNFWKGGVSSAIYPVDWTETLRRGIRERDKYMCQRCGKAQGDRALDVHHIDENRENNDVENLITFCHSCHMITHIEKQENAKSKS